MDVSFPEDPVPSYYSINPLLMNELLCRTSLWQAFRLSKSMLVNRSIGRNMAHIFFPFCASTSKQSHPEPYMYRVWPTWFQSITTWRIFFCFVLDLLSSIRHIQQLEPGWPNCVCLWLWLYVGGRSHPEVTGRQIRQY